jgi:hypothetical protein
MAPLAFRAISLVRAAPTRVDWRGVCSAPSVQRPSAVQRNRLMEVKAASLLFAARRGLKDHSRRQPAFVLPGRSTRRVWRRRTGLMPLADQEPPTLVLVRVK